MLRFGLNFIIYLSHFISAINCICFETMDLISVKMLKHRYTLQTISDCELIIYLICIYFTVVAKYTHATYKEGRK